MNRAFYKGFVKEALSSGHALVALGAALGGLAIYDFFKGRSFPTLGKEDLRGKGRERVDAKVWLETLLKKKPLKRPPVVVTRIEDLEAALKGDDFAWYEKSQIRRFAKYVFRTESNAFVVPGKTKDLLVIPSKIHKHVVEHELGHVRDFAEKPYKKPGVIDSVLAGLWKPTFEQQVLEREERAWAHTKARKLKEGAIGSYHRGFHRGRMIQAGVGSYLGISRGLEALRGAKDAKHISQVPRT